MKKKQPLRLRAYTVVSRAVEEGIAHGLNRYNKYNIDAPINTDTAASHLEREILSALCDVVNFEDET